MKRTYNRHLPQYGLGAMIKKASSFVKQNPDVIGGLGVGAAAAGQVGNPNGFKGFLSGAGSGVAAGATFGPWGAAIGGLVGGVAGLIKGKKQKAEQERLLEQQENEEALAQKRFEENEAALEYQRSKGVLNQHPTEGISDVNYYGKIYKYGGNIGKRRMLRRAMYGGDPQYLAEDAEVVDFDPANPPQVHSGGNASPVSSNMVELDGDSHSDSSGGIAMSGGERIYSDKIKPSPLSTEVLKSYRINPTGTYADVAKRIGNKISKEELDVMSDDRFKKERATRTIQKLETAKDVLFADQEAFKPDDNMGQFKYGGKVPKYEFGALVGMGKAVGDAAMKNKKPKLDIQLPNSTKTEFYKNIYGQPTPQNSQSGFGAGVSKVGSFLGENADMLAAGAGYLANERIIDQIPLTQKTRMYNPVLMGYNDRSGEQQARIGSSARQGFRAINAGSTQTRNAAVGDIVSRATDASNEVATAESRRRDAIMQNNTQIINQGGLYNTEMANRTYGDYQQNRMLKLGEKMNNRNNLIQSILGNLQVRKMNEMDMTKMALIAERDKERGIIGRSDTFKDIMERYTKRKSS